MITEESKVKETNSFKFLACLDPQKLKLKLKIKIHIKIVSLKNLSALHSNSYYFINPSVIYLKVTLTHISKMLMCLIRIPESC